MRESATPFRCGVPSPVGLLSRMQSTSLTRADDSYALGPVQPHFKKRMMVPAMATNEGDSREGFEGWIEHRIRKALENLPHPFERKLTQLRQRIEQIQKRMQHLSCRIEEPGSTRSEKLSDPEPRDRNEPLKPAL